MRVVYSLSQAEWCDTMCTLIIWYPNFIAYNMHYDCLIFNLGWWSTPLLYLSHLWDCLYVLSWWPNIIMWSHYYGDSQPQTEIATTSANSPATIFQPIYIQLELTEQIKMWSQQIIYNKWARSCWLDKTWILSQQTKIQSV